MVFEIYQDDFGGFVHVARAHVRTYPTFDWWNPLNWWVSMYVPNLSAIGPIGAELQQGQNRTFGHTRGTCARVDSYPF